MRQLLFSDEIAIRIRTVVCTLLVLGSLVACSDRPEGPPSPGRDELIASSYDCNVLVVLLDAAAAKHFGAWGYDRPTTPRIDALATESVLFERAHSQASGTAMSVYSIFSSHYPVLEKVPGLIGSNAVLLADTLTTLPEALARRIDHRLLISTNPFVTPTLGFGQGMTTVIEDWKPGPQARNGEPPRYADRVTRPALGWIHERGTAPWFAYLHYLEPHAPYMPPEPWRSRLKRHEAPLKAGDLPFLRNMPARPPVRMQEVITDLYDGNLAWVDSQVGALVDSLKAEGTWDRTIFVLIADHGDGFWEHGTKGHGGIPYEELVHVPLLLRIPGVPELAGRHIQRPVELVDLMPTLLELKGIDRHEVEMVGRSWIPLLVGEEEDAAFPMDRTIHVRSNRTRRPVFGMQRGRWKWLFHVHDESQELYDLDTDPGEQNNLVANGEALPHDILDFPKLLKEWLNTGLLQSGGSTSVDNRMLDHEMIESLKSLGYIE